MCRRQYSEAPAKIGRGFKFAISGGLLEQLAYQMAHGRRLNR
jgi:hypothetical protein